MPPRAPRLYWQSYRASSRYFNLSKSAQGAQALDQPAKPIDSRGNSIPRMPAWFQMCADSGLPSRGCCALRLRGVNWRVALVPRALLGARSGVGSTVVG